MEKPLVIRNGHVIDPGNGVDMVKDIFIDRNGYMRQVPDGSFQDRECDIFDASGMVVCPGFIDLHCHLRQPGYEEKETIATGTKAAAKGGFTTVCCMPNTSPALDSTEIITYVKEVAASEGAVRVIPIASVTRERKGKELSPLSELAGAGIAGFSDDGSPVYDESIMREALESNLDTELPVIEHCEVPELAGDGVMNEGEVSRKLGLKGIPAAAEEQMVARDIRLAAETGGWVHTAHASTAGSVHLIREGKAKGIHVTAEVTPHHLTLTENEVLNRGSQAKVNPPLRTEKDIEALIEGLNDGTIDIIATDHAPHTMADKQGSIQQAAFGFSVFETALGSLMKLVHEGRISLPLLIKKMTCGPAGLLKRYPEITGTIRDDTLADITIFDPDLEWTVNSRDFVSKGKNTSLDGIVLKGKVLAVMRNGEFVYKDTGLKIG
ncbi:MAG: dihydroorotase [Dehalococcoidales bacterium]|nr:dihydroorotase [Dehalococcoidales bacterium]